MIQGIAPSLRELISEIRVADILDIAVISVCLHFVIQWIRRRSSRPVAIGITVLALLYVLARRMDMYLTSLLFQAGFTAILVAMVLIFQEDLRRFFEQLVARSGVGMGGGTREAAEPWSKTVDRLVQASMGLANQKIGALIAIRGREDIERHIRGGVFLNGEITIPLLHSIFQPKSPAHDGAVVIEDRRIERFAAHLPLSNNHEALGERGTRHAAGLGLSEKSDALVIIVSEETGSISVAERGELAVMDSPAGLTFRLSEHYRMTLPSSRPLSAKPFVRNLGAKVSSVILAFALWLLVAYQPEMVQRTFTVPIEYRNLSVGLIIDEEAPAQAQVTMAGPERVFDLLNPGTLVISLDLSGMEARDVSIPLNEPQVQNKPAGLEVRQFDPDTVRLRIRDRSG